MASPVIVVTTSEDNAKLPTPVRRLSVSSSSSFDFGAVGAVGAVDAVGAVGAVGVVGAKGDSGGEDCGDECPGCETGCEGSAHIDPATNDYYKTCVLAMNTCIWCGRPSGEWDYCSSNCAIIEKRHDDAMSSMY